MELILLLKHNKKFKYKRNHFEILFAINLSFARIERKLYINVCQVKRSRTRNKRLIQGQLEISHSFYDSL